MQKTIILLVYFILLSFISYSQYYPVAMKEKLVNSTHIIQGEVVKQECIYIGDEIYTENYIQISKILKGNQLDTTIVILANGGSIDGISFTVSHGYSLSIGDSGFFFIKPSNIIKDQRQGNIFELYSGRQGYYKREFNGLSTTIVSYLSEYSGINSFYKSIGIEFNDKLFEIEQYKKINPELCLNYRLEPTFEPDFTESNEITFNLFVQSTEVIKLKQLELALNYSELWFGDSIVLEQKIQFSSGDFSNYSLSVSDISTNTFQISLTSLNLDSMRILSSNELLVCTFHVEFIQIANEQPVFLENSDFTTTFYTLSNRQVTNSCGEIEIIREDCMPEITEIDISKSAGNEMILTIIGDYFIYPGAEDDDDCDVLPNLDHRVKFTGVHGGWVSPLKGDYLEWSMKKIRVKVPTEGYRNNSNSVRTKTINDEYAGTGKIKICLKDYLLYPCYCGDVSDDGDNDPKSQNLPYTSGELYIPYSTYSRDDSELENVQEDCLKAKHCRLFM